MNAQAEDVSEEVTEAAAAKVAEEVKIRSAFDSAKSGDKSEDEIKMEMITAGAKFKNVTRFYNQFMIDAGYAVSKEDKDAAVEKVCSGQDLTSEDVFNGVCADLVANVEGTTDRQASSWVRGYAKKNELECWKKPKGEGVGRSGFASKFYDFISGKDGRSEADATAFIMGTDGNEETSGNVQKHLSHYMSIHSLVEAAVAAR